MAEFRIPHPRLQNFEMLLIFVVAFGVFAISMQVVMLLTDWLWFKKVGYQ